ncbi:MAG: glycosyltransferase family 4 protein, partial [Synergistes sp.]|nr:glycosyltransferase family 4 protein [Synergistes sp.]
MKIIEILPELDIGGVERHVIDLSNELVRRGHEVIVISAGGKMQSQLRTSVRHINLPVHKKNPFTGWLCAKKIAHIAKTYRADLIHAHSRVPAWIAMIAAKNAGIPFITTAHSDFSTKTRWIYKPYRDANVNICVSRAVLNGMKGCFSDNTKIILNGLDTPNVSWQMPGGTPKFLYIGRLVEYKGIQDALHAMPKELSWTFDIVGEGNYRKKLEELVKELGFYNRVTFHGYSDKTDEFMVNASCFIFPSHDESFGLALARAAQIGLPFIATNIDAFSELCGSQKGLIDPGDITGLNKAIAKFIKTKNTEVVMPKENIPTLDKMTDEVIKVYEDVLSGFEKNK